VLGVACNEEAVVTVESLSQYRETVFDGLGTIILIVDALRA
jgi:hypothetical protein